MRPLLVTSGFSASEDDWCIPALLDLVRRLSRHAEPTVLPLRYPAQGSPYRVGGAQVEPLGAGQAGGWRRGPLIGRALLRILAVHRRHPVDLVHALFAHEPGFVAALAAVLLRRPLIVSVLGGELAALAEIGWGGQLSRTNAWMARWALRRARRVTVGSEWLRRSAEPLGSAVVLPLGVSLERFHPAGELAASSRLDGSPAILQVASLTPVKGQRTLLEAFAGVHRRLPEARLHLVGDGPLRTELEGLVACSGLGDAVRLHGALDHTALPGLYRRADLFVVSSHFEAQGMAALEAAACGCALVGTAVGVVPDIAAAPAVAPGDGPALAGAIVAAWGDPRRVEAARQRSLRVAETWGVETVAERWWALYRELGTAG